MPTSPKIVPRPWSRVGKLGQWLALKLTRSPKKRALRSGLFDADWYLETYPEVATAGHDPFEHYVSMGAREGRDPGPRFSTRRYQQRYPDMVQSGVNPLLHYLEFGLREGREIFPVERPTSAYDDWIAAEERQDDTALAHMRKRAVKLTNRPLISVLMPTFNTEIEFLRAAIESVLAQSYDRFELCIADDASTDAEVRQVLGDYAESDPRIKVVYRNTQGGIARASNAALDIASGSWIAMLDHDDVLAPQALLRVAETINANPGAQLIYSDEDKISGTGRRYNPYFKPEFSLELFRSQNYLNHLTVHRTKAVREVGGWRPDFDGSQDYDLNLRIIERIDRSTIHHIPEVLYHWRAVVGSTALAVGEKDRAYTAGSRALNDHVNRLGLTALVEEAPGVPFYRLRFAPPRPAPLVSLIVPTRDRADLLKMSVGSILAKTTYEPFEVIIVDNGSVEEATRDLLNELGKEPRIRVLAYPHPFNYAALNNFAAGAAKGDLLGLVNNDIEVLSPDWLTEMVSWAAQEEVGCVGAKLYYPDGSIQHGGVILGIGGVAGHAHKTFPGNEAGYFGRLKVVQNLSAVTGACLVVRKQLYFEVGGLDEALSVAFNDVDLCLKVRDAGYRNVWTPYAELYHHESVSRGYEHTRERRARFAKEVAYMKQKWGDALTSDPFYSAHLSLDREDFSIREHRRPRPRAKTKGRRKVDVAGGA
jgi:glycosyltransferase involved in cell wall biosynthesis